MNFKKIFQYQSIAYILLNSHIVHAGGGIDGANGTSSGNVSPLIGELAGYSAGNNSADQGAAANDISGKTININTSIISGSAGANAPDVQGAGGSGAGGHGGGSAIGGISIGGTGGNAGGNVQVTSASGGQGGNISGNQITVNGTQFNGGNAGTGGNFTNANAAFYGGAGAGGHGGGSVFGGISTGGAAGQANKNIYSLSNGGAGGDISANRITLKTVDLYGGNAGGGGGMNVTSSNNPEGAAGAGGHGGGSVFGGVSTGGAAGYSGGTSNGGAGGRIFNNIIDLENTKLYGGAAGSGGSLQALWTSYGGAGSGGHKGGSVFGGVSTGGAGGFSIRVGGMAGQANGGRGGDVFGNQITLRDVLLQAPVFSPANPGDVAPGVGGSVKQGFVGNLNPGHGGNGVDGLDGGSVYGGVSVGGSGGYTEGDSNSKADGGHGGDIYNNKITISGKSEIEGDIYGGISIGGLKGEQKIGGNAATPGQDGYSGKIHDNWITLIGKDIQIGGSIYGGKSLNCNPSYGSNCISGNGLTLKGYEGSVEGIYHIEKFHWVLSKDVVNVSKVITIRGNDKVHLDNTTHTAAMFNDGNLLNSGDRIILIDKVQGQPVYKTDQTVEQGQIILYNARLEVINVGGMDQLTLVIDSDARANPKAKAFLEGRASMLAMVNHGTDAVSEAIMTAARMNSADGEAGMFVSGSGGKSRYSTGSHIDVNDSHWSWGVSQGWMLPGGNWATVGAVVDHAQGSYETYNHFGAAGEVRGQGKAQTHGVGLVTHIGKQGAAITQWGDAPGPYVKAALRIGRATHSFDSADMTDATGVAGRYQARMRYTSAMLGAGYVLPLPNAQALHLYGRYSWDQLQAGTVQVGNSVLSFAPSTSARWQLGARWSRTWQQRTTSYVGLAVEHEARGQIAATSSGLNIPQPSLQGNAGMVELGLAVKPASGSQALSIDIGTRAYVGKRKGFSATVKAQYVF